MDNFFLRKNVFSPRNGESLENANRRLAIAMRHLMPLRKSLSFESSNQEMTPCSSDVPHHPHDKDIFYAPADYSRKAHIKNREQYLRMWRHSIDNPDAFWSNIAEDFYWKKKWNIGSVVNANLDLTKGPVFVEWFKGGYTNICYNAVDRHVAAGRGDDMAILWEGNEPSCDARITFGQLKAQVCQAANFLRSVGVRKGDTVGLYMPMIAELPIAMLACARIGAIHSVVFGGFSAESLAGRLSDCKAKVLLTCNAVNRGEKVLVLKSIVDKALEIAEKRDGLTIRTCLVYDNSRACSRAKTPFTHLRDRWWQDEVQKQSTEAYVEWMEAEDPLFMLYTSGSTGKPKGVLHTTGGYMVYAATTCKYVFDLQPNDVFWCTADCGWITGHTYVTYGPLLNGTTIVVFEGVPTWPDAGRCWDIVDKYGVTIFYTAPTAIRSLEAQGDHFVLKHSRASLRLLGTVGEPINPRAWHWYFDIVGGGRCPIVDTWWQTETGGAAITPLPGVPGLKPGCASLPFFGIEPVILNQKGVEQEGSCEGYLCIKKPWPGIARTLFGDHERFQETYFGPWKGYYTTGDGCRRDSDGYIWITGRVDDVINVSGHRISTEEVESALNSHPDCAEAAVVGIDHDIKGQGIYAYVVVMEGTTAGPDLKKILRETVRKEIGSFAAPDVIHWAKGLPKTRSGKIMRRILRKIATNKTNELGDVSSLAEPSVVDDLINSFGI